ncbi:MAG: hypothetical protein AB8C46_00040 [Burkholderiaceae bacterium]
MSIPEATDLLAGMLNPFLFLAVGFFWLVLSPRLAGSWFLLGGGCLLFLNEALAYYEATHQTTSSWVNTMPYAISTEAAPILLAVGILLVARAKSAESRSHLSG